MTFGHAILGSLFVGLSGAVGLFFLPSLMSLVQIFEGGHAGTFYSLLSLHAIAVGVASAYYTPYLLLRERHAWGSRADLHAHLLGCALIAAILGILFGSPAAFGFCFLYLGATGLPAVFALAETRNWFASTCAVA